MPSTTDFGSFIAGKLAARILTSTTTGVTVTIQEVNGAYPTWPTGAHRIMLYRKTRTGIEVECCGVAAGTTQSSATVTLGTLTRGLSLTDGSDFTGDAARKRVFAANAEVYITWDTQSAENTAFKDIANTFSAKQTFSAGVDFTGTTRPPKLPSYTTAQRDLLTPETGFKIINTTTGTEQTYYGGTWNDAGTSTTGNASDGTSGKVDIATTTEIGAGTNTDGSSGAINVLPVSVTVKTSSGSSDENKIPVLGADGKMASGFIPSTSAGVGFFGDGSDGDVTISSPTSLTRDMFYDNLTVEAAQTLNPAGFRIFVKNTLTLTGTISCNGGNGGAGGTGSSGTGGAAGTAGAAAAAAGYFTAPRAGKAGGAGGGGGAFATNGAGGSNGTAGTSETNALITSAAGAGANSGAGGNSNATNGGAGATGQAGGTATAIAAGVRNAVHLINWNVFIQGTATHPNGGASAGSGAGGGGGGGGNVGGDQGGAGGGGGGSGGNGGYVLVCANTITGAGNINARGGHGGAGGAGQNGVSGSGGGGGGGGGGAGGTGGCVVLLYRTQTAWTATIGVTGGNAGAAGAAGTGLGTGGLNGNAGSAGAAGTAGFSLTLQI